jgi:hypothetical protein
MRKAAEAAQLERELQAQLQQLLQGLQAQRQQLEQQVEASHAKERELQVCLLGVRAQPCPPLRAGTPTTHTQPC